MRNVRLAAIMATLPVIACEVAYAQQSAVGRIPDRSSRAPALELSEAGRIGTADGASAFGRIMDVAADSRGRIFVADDLNHRVSVFSSTGGFIRTLGRRGRGPGEFESPWAIGIDARDSVFVWDMNLARISVFGPDLVFRRSFQIAPQWVVNSIEFLRNGNLLIAAFATGEDNGIHVLGRTGILRQSFAPVNTARNLAGFEGSVLGGSLDVSDAMIVYSRKSPYEVMFYDQAGRLLRHCRGSGEMTTPPEQVVVSDASRAGLEWRRFVHSARVVAVGGGMVINTIVDPTNDSRIVDLLDSDCALIRRTQLKAPVTIVERSGSKLLAVSNVEYPEIIIYNLHMRNPQ